MSIGSTVDQSARANGRVQHRPNEDREYRHLFWEDRSRIVLTPIAAPSVLGLFGFFAATLAVGTNLAGWWGNDTTTALYLVPFAIVLGGVAQFAAGLFAYGAFGARTGCRVYGNDAITPVPFSPTSSNRATPDRRTLRYVSWTE